VKVSVLTNTGECAGCGWSGSVRELIATEVKHDLGTDDEISILLVKDMAKTMGSCAHALGKFLLKWGFLTQLRTTKGIVLDQKELERYVRAMASASLKAVIEERQKMEVERARKT